MKKCPVCAELIQDEAVKCRYCGEFLNKKGYDKWFYKTYILVFAFLCVGPLALPLLWFNPNYSTMKKWFITLIVVLISVVFGVFFIKSLIFLKEYYTMAF